MEGRGEVLGEKGQGPVSEKLPVFAVFEMWLRCSRKS